jgi:hypothetical protein
MTLSFFFFLRSFVGLVRFDRFVVQALHVLKGLIKCKLIEFLTPDKEKSAKLQQSREKRLSFWTNDRVAQFSEVLILRYFPFTQEELESWKHQPEEFLTIEEEDNPTNTLRVSFLFVCSFFKYSFFEHLSLHFHCFSLAWNTSIPC